MNTTISHHPRSGATSRKGLTWLSALVAGVTMIGSASLQAQVGDTSIVVFPNSGNSVSVAGVKYSGPNTNWPGHNEINHNPITCDSQALSLDLGEEVGSAMATFTAFQASEAGGREEVGQWEAFDAGGLPVRQTVSPRTALAPGRRRFPPLDLPSWGSDRWSPRQESRAAHRAKVRQSGRPC